MTETYNVCSAEDTRSVLGQVVLVGNVCGEFLLTAEQHVVIGHQDILIKHLSGACSDQWDGLSLT